MGKQKLDLKIEELEERIAPLPAVQVSLGGVAWDGQLSIQEGDGTFTFELVEGKDRLVFNKVTGSPLDVKFSLVKIPGPPAPFVPTPLPGP